MLAALPLVILACSGKSFSPYELVENPVVCSPNGRYCAVMRRYERVPDFTALPAEAAFGDQVLPARDTFTAALYDRDTLAAKILIDKEMLGEVLVSDSGRYLVAVQRLRGVCGYRASADDRFATITRSDGSHAAALKFDDVLNPYDIEQLEQVNVRLRVEADGRELLVLSAAGAERRIDLATAALLDEKRDILPAPRVYATAGDGEESKRLFAHAIVGPLPDFPIVAYRARIRGIVRVAVTVDENGEVVSAEVTKPLPFGLSEAAVETARQWKFKRLTKLAGEIVFHFEDIDADRFEEIMRTAPALRRAR